MVRTLFLHFHWVLYPLQSIRMTLYLNRFRRKPAISMFDWPFTPFHNSSPSIATDVSAVLQISFDNWFASIENFKNLQWMNQNFSTWSWKDHMVSGLLLSTQRTIDTRFRFAFTFLFKLAEKRKSLAHYAKGTPKSSRAFECFWLLNFKCISFPFTGTFHLSLTVLVRYRSYQVFKLWRWYAKFNFRLLVKKFKILTRWLKIK